MRRDTLAETKGKFGKFIASCEELLGYGLRARDTVKHLATICELLAAPWASPTNCSYHLQNEAPQNSQQEFANELQCSNRQI